MHPVSGWVGGWVTLVGVGRSSTPALQRAVAVHEHERAGQRVGLGLIGGDDATVGAVVHEAGQRVGLGGRARHCAVGRAGGHAAAARQQTHQRAAARAAVVVAHAAQRVAPVHQPGQAVHGHGGGRREVGAAACAVLARAGVAVHARGGVAQHAVREAAGGAEAADDAVALRGDQHTAGAHGSERVSTAGWERGGRQRGC